MPDQPRWLTEREQQNWRAYLYSSRRLMDALDRDLQQKVGIPHGYYEIFVCLSEAPDRSMRMSELAVVTHSSRSRLSHAVARLEEAGWVERQDCPTDRRGQVAHMTDDGFALLEKAAPLHVEAVHRFLVDPLSAEQFDQLGEIGHVIDDAVATSDGSVTRATADGSVPR